jgi:hypothetical protein
VQRPAHRPRLDERAPFRQQLGDVAGAEVLDARPQRQLGARGDLRVQAGDVGDDGERRVARRARRQVLALEPPGEHGVP